jgi:L-aspartate oxidase
LASNSLLEALVMADRAARDAAKTMTEVKTQESRVESQKSCSLAGREQGDTAKVGGLASGLKATMSKYAAIVRSDQGLAVAAKGLGQLHDQIETLASEQPNDVQVQELHNMVLIGRLIVHCARFRRESRGLHYNTDCPAHDDVHFRRDTIVTKGDIS